jgi:hypothetical protein
MDTSEAREAVFLHHTDARPDSKAIRDWSSRFQVIQEKLQELADKDVATDEQHRRAANAR